MREAARPIRVLHFAGIINRHDIIDVVLSRLDRSRFDIRALTVLPARQTGSYAPGGEYPVRCLDASLSLRRLPLLLRALAREVAEFRPDILQAHHYLENLVACLVARRFRLPAYVIGRHYSDHIYYLTRGAKRALCLAAENWCNRTARCIAVPAPDIAALLIERQGVPREKIEVIPFGLDLDRYRPSAPEAPSSLRAALGIGSEALIVACCRMNPEKGLHVLLAAYREVRRAHPGCRLALVGMGPEEGTLRRRALELGVSESVHFAGWQDTPLDWLAAADVIAIPSMCESFCQVLMEGLALSRPVVMTPVGAAPDVLGDNERGLIVPRGDAPALAAALTRLVGDPALRDELGRRGREFLWQHMDASVSARKYSELYGRLCPR